jgi:hypothetical protein
VKASTDNRDLRYGLLLIIRQGPFVIRVHEPDKEYDNQVYIQDQIKTFDVPYHTRYKKIKKTIRKVESQGLDGAEIEEQVDMKSIEWIRFVSFF